MEKERERDQEGIERAWNYQLGLEMEWWWKLYWGLVLVIMMKGGHTEGGEVTYDGRSLIIDGQRKMLFSGSIHYPRSTPEVNDISSKSLLGTKLRKM